MRFQALSFSAHLLRITIGPASAFLGLTSVPLHSNNRSMPIDDISRQVIDRCEWVAIATAGAKGPHLAATWGDYVRKLGISDEFLLIPAGYLHQTEDNLRHDPRIELLFATRQVTGNHGPGRGCAINGRGEVVASGAHADAVKSKFPWARAALVVHIESVSLQL